MPCSGIWLDVNVPTAKCSVCNQRYNTTSGMKKCSTCGRQMCMPCHSTRAATHGSFFTSSSSTTAATSQRMLPISTALVPTIPTTSAPTSRQQSRGSPAASSSRTTATLRMSRSSQGAGSSASDRFGPYVPPGSQRSVLPSKQAPGYNQEPVDRPTPSSHNTELMPPPPHPSRHQGQTAQRRQSSRLRSHVPTYNVKEMAGSDGAQPLAKSTTTAYKAPSSSSSRPSYTGPSASSSTRSSFPGTSQGFRRFPIVPGPSSLSRPQSAMDLAEMGAFQIHEEDSSPKATDAQRRRISPSSTSTESSPMDVDKEESHLGLPYVPKATASGRFAPSNTSESPSLSPSRSTPLNRPVTRVRFGRQPTDFKKETRSEAFEKMMEVIPLHPDWRPAVPNYEEPYSRIGLLPRTKPGPRDQVQKVHSSSIPRTVYRDVDSNNMADKLAKKLPSRNSAARPSYPQSADEQSHVIGASIQHPDPKRTEEHGIRSGHAGLEYNYPPVSNLRNVSANTQKPVNEKTEIRKLIANLPGEAYDHKRYRMLHGAIETQPDRFTAEEIHEANHMLKDLLPGDNTLNMESPSQAVESTKRHRPMDESPTRDISKRKEGRRAKKSRLSLDQGLPEGEEIRFQTHATSVPRYNPYDLPPHRPVLPVLGGYAEHDAATEQAAQALLEMAHGDRQNLTFPRRSIISSEMQKVDSDATVSARGESLERHVSAAARSHRSSARRSYGRSPRAPRVRRAPGYMRAFRGQADLSRMMREEEEPRLVPPAMTPQQFYDAPPPAHGTLSPMVPPGFSSFLQQQQRASIAEGGDSGPTPEEDTEEDEDMYDEVLGGRG